MAGGLENLFISVMVGQFPCGILENKGIVHRIERTEYTYTYLMRCLECGNREVINKENHPDFLQELETKKESFDFWKGVAAATKQEYNLHTRIDSFEKMVMDSLGEKVWREEE